MEALIRELPSAIQSPYALAAYALLVIVLITTRRGGKKIKDVMAHINKVSPDKQLDVIRAEYNTVLPKSITVAQFLKQKKTEQIFFIIMAIIVCAFVIVIVAITKASDVEKSIKAQKEATEKAAKEQAQFAQEQRIAAEKQRKASEELLAGQRRQQEQAEALRPAALTYNVNKDWFELKLDKSNGLTNISCRAFAMIIPNIVGVGNRVIALKVSGAIQDDGQRQKAYGLNFGGMCEHIRSELRANGGSVSSIQYIACVSADVTNTDGKMRTFYFSISMTTGSSLCLDRSNVNTQIEWYNQYVEMYNKADKLEYLRENGIDLLHQKIRQLVARGY